jgi:hypothetical protein
LVLVLLRSERIQHWFHLILVSSLFWDARLLLQCHFLLKICLSSSYPIDSILVSHICLGIYLFPLFIYGYDWEVFAVVILLGLF